MRLAFRIVAFLVFTTTVVLFIINGIRSKTKLLQPMLPMITFGGGLSDNVSDSDELSLVLFTTFKNSPDRLYIQYNTVRSWTLLKPAVQPVLFTTKEKGDGVQMLESYARDLGWQLYPAPRVNSAGIPYLEDMYRHIASHYNVSFAGYANGDLLFDQGITRTVRAAWRQSVMLKNKTLIIGRRTDYEMSTVETIDVEKTDEVATLAKKRGKLFQTNAIDYFLMSGSFPWQKVPDDLVIGRPGYDNFLVSIALSNDVSVVDATKTLLAFHQTGIDGHFAGARNSDSGFNIAVVRKKIGIFNYAAGDIGNSRYLTTQDPKGGVIIYKRPPKPPKSKPKAHAKNSKQPLAPKPKTAAKGK